MKFKHRLLALGIGSMILASIVPIAAFAQVPGEQCSDMQMLAGKCGKQKSKKTEQAKPETKYPNATRKQPSNLGVSSDKEAKAINEGLHAANTGDSATALKDLQPIADNSKSAYARAMATLGLAQVKYRSGDTKGAIALQKRALDSNALDNDAYFQGLLSLAQMYNANEDYKDALSTLDTFRKESGAQSADAYGLEALAYYRMQKYPEAVAAAKKARSLSSKPQANLDQIEMASYFAMDKYDEAAKLAEAALAKDPNNATLLQNVIAIYTNAGQDKKALALMERARKNGQINDANGYLNMARIYDNIGQGSSDPKSYAMKAVGVIKEGQDKGILKPGFDTYKLLGHSYVVAGDYKQALEAYTKAAPDAKTGEIEFRRGQLLANLGQNKQARTALKQALAKGGFDHEAAAWLALGNVEFNLKDKAAATAAYKHAEQDPETRDQARKMLKRLGHK